jgi:uncharacterized protein (DUF924 family)
MPLMHSEDMADHDLMVNKLKQTLATLPPEHHMNSVLKFELDHRDVIVKFGR